MDVRLGDVEVGGVYDVADVEAEDLFGGVAVSAGGGGVRGGEIAGQIVGVDNVVGALDQGPVPLFALAEGLFHLGEVGQFDILLLKDAETLFGVNRLGQLIEEMALSGGFVDGDLTVVHGFYKLLREGQVLRSCSRESLLFMSLPGTF